MVPPSSLTPHQQRSRNDRTRGNPRRLDLGKLRLRRLHLISDCRVILPSDRRVPGDLWEVRHIAIHDGDFRLQFFAELDEGPHSCGDRRAGPYMGVRAYEYDAIRDFEMESRRVLGAQAVLMIRLHTAADGAIYASETAEAPHPI